MALDNNIVSITDEQALGLAQQYANRLGISPDQHKLSDLVDTKYTSLSTGCFHYNGARVLCVLDLSELNSGSVDDTYNAFVDKITASIGSEDGDVGQLLKERFLASKGWSGDSWKKGVKNPLVEALQCLSKHNMTKHLLVGLYETIRNGEYKTGTEQSPLLVVPHLSDLPELYRIFSRFESSVLIGSSQTMLSRNKVYTAGSR